MSEILTDAEVEKINKMCPSARDANLGQLIKEMVASITDLDARVTVLESTA